MYLICKLDSVYYQRHSISRKYRFFCVFFLNPALENCPLVVYNYSMEIQIYRDKNGNEPFEQWLSSIKDNPTWARIDNRLKRVRLGLLGDHRLIGEGVFELRLDFGPGYRIYFGRIGREHILLLTGGDKSSQRRDIAIAKQYWQHFKESAE